MKATQENVDWGYAQLERLIHMKSFPPTAPSLDAVVRAFLRIVGDQPEHVYQDYDDELGPIERRVEARTGQSTGEWLVEQILDRCEFFPAPIQMRRIYEERNTPDDGRRSAEMGTE